MVKGVCTLIKSKAERLDSNHDDNNNLQKSVEKKVPFYKIYDMCFCIG